MSNSDVIVSVLLYFILLYLILSLRSLSILLYLILSLRSLSISNERQKGVDLDGKARDWEEEREGKP